MAQTALASLSLAFSIPEFITFSSDYHSLWNVCFEKPFALK